jgi:hypothetical protein
MTTINLTSPYTLQKAKTSSSATIIQVTEDFVENTVSALVGLSDDPKDNTWISVWDSESYDINWTQEQLESRIAEVLEEQSEAEASA